MAYTPHPVERLHIVVRLGGCRLVVLYEELFYIPPSAASDLLSCAMVPDCFS